MSDTSPPGAPAPRFAAASLIAVIFINMLGFGIIVPLLPFYAKSFNAPAWQIALIFSFGVHAVLLLVRIVDPASFNRIFKKMAGMTPSEYRLKYKAGGASGTAAMKAGPVSPPESRQPGD